MDRGGVAAVEIRQSDGTVVELPEVVVRFQSAGSELPMLIDEPEGRRQLGDISHGKFWQLCERGLIETVHIGRRRMVVTESLTRYVRSLQGGAA